MKIAHIFTLNFSKINNLEEFYEEISNLFGFPNFFGRNISALIDCLSGLRYPEEGMLNTYITQSECIVIELINFSACNEQIQQTILRAVEFVNYRCILKNQIPSILIMIVKK